MSEEQQLRLQAYLDGELPEEERRQVESWLASDEGARALLDELSSTVNALRENEPEHRPDCSREFYWSGIAREIEKAETPASNLASKDGVLRWLMRHLAPVATGAVALVVLAIFSFPKSAPEEPVVDSAWEVLDPDTAMVNYTDFENGITVVMLYDQ